MATVTVSPRQVQKLLTKIPSGVKVELSKTPDGAIEVTTTEPPKTKADIINEKFPDLVGQGITLTEASKKYGTPRRTIEKWVYRNEYVSRVDELAYPQTFDEAEIAYCAEIYHERKKAGVGVYGAPLLDDNGLPYQLRYPERAEKRKKTGPLAD